MDKNKQQENNNQTDDKKQIGGDNKQNSNKEQNKQDNSNKGEKVIIDGKEYTVDEIKQEIERIKKAESEINQKYIEMANIQKEIEPVLQLQQYLADNPDKASIIADILEGKDTKKEDNKFETDIPEVKQLKEEVDKLKEQLQKSVSGISFKEKVKEEQEFLAANVKNLAQKYEDLDEEVLYAKLLAIPNISSLPRPQVAQLMESIAKEIDNKIKEKKEQYLQKYLKEKEDINKKSIGEGKGGMGGKEQEKIKNLKITDGSAKNAAIEYLKKIGLK